MVIDIENYEEAQEEEENSSGGGSTTVVVTGDPSEGEEVTQVGQGDTVEEAERDAATNPDFDADTGDSVNEIEKNLGTNQPLQNPEGSTNKELKQAAQEIAGSEQFQGDRVGRQAGELAQQLENTKTKRQRQKEIEFAQNNILQRATPQDIFTTENASTTDPRNEIEKRLENAAQSIPRQFDDTKGGGFVEGSIETGVEIQQGGAQFVDEAAEKISTRDNFQADAGRFFVPITATDIPQQIDDSNKSKTQIQEEAGLSASSATKGAGTLGTQAGGLAVALPGSVSRSFREDTPGLVTGALSGFTLAGQQLEENPIEFISSEAGEEAGEAAVGAAISGGAGAALAGTPSIELDPEGKPGQGLEKIRQARRQAEDIQNSAVGLITGNLGTRPRQDQLISRDIESLEEQALQQRLRNLETTGNQETSAEIAQSVDDLTPTDIQETTLLEENVERAEDGTIVRRVQGVQNGQAVQGQRLETPVSRKEFASELLTKEIVARIGALGLQGAAAASGAPTTTAGSGITLENTPETTSENNPESSPDRIQPEEVFNTQEGVPEQTLNTENTFTPTLEETNTQTNDQTPSQNQDNPPENIQQQDPFQIQDPEQTPRQEQNPFVTPEQQQEPIIPQEEIIQDPRPEQKTQTNTLTINQSDQNNLNDLFSTGLEAEEDPEAAPSVDAILFGDTTDEEVEDDTIFTGFETREISEEFNLF